MESNKGFFVAQLNVSKNGSFPEESHESQEIWEKVGKVAKKFGDSKGSEVSPMISHSLIWTWQC